MSKEEQKKQEDVKQAAQNKEPKAEKQEKGSAPAEAKQEKKAPEQSKAAKAPEAQAPAKPKALKAVRLKVTQMTREEAETALAEVRRKMGTDDQSRHAQNLIARLSYLNKYEHAGAGASRKAA